MTGKGVVARVSSGALGSVTIPADFGSEKAIVFFDGPIVGGTIDDTTIGVTFTAPYGGCSFEQLSFQNIADSGPTGNCYTIEQTCGSGTSVYGTLYVDIYCQFPGQTTPIQMNYVQSFTDVDEVFNC
eukprot:jgi/Ulvmu1/2075/UM123_0007.1